jgi:aminoglycoside 3-N-acetyltransferase I
MLDQQSVSIAKLNNQDVPEFEKLIEIFNAVFENKKNIPPNEYLSKVLSNPDFLVFTVLVEGEIVGGLTLFVLPAYYEVQSLAYIYDIGIDPKFQRRGLGKKLLSEVCGYCKKQKISQAFVQAETEDADAIAFYNRTMFSSQIQATHFTYNL